MLKQLNQSCFGLLDNQLLTGAELVMVGFIRIPDVVLTGHEGVVNDLEKQPQLSPQDRQHLLRPRQKRQTSGPEARHFCPFVAALGTNGRSHLRVFGTVLTYSGTLQRK